MPEEGSHFSEEIHGVLNNNGFLPQISYPNSAGKLKHVGDVVKFFPSKLDATYTHNDGQYNMIQWHIHTPSEHRVEGRDYVAEIHCTFFIYINCSRSSARKRIGCYWRIY